jgi:DNA replication protein DnaC
MKNRLRFANIPETFREMTLSNFKFGVYRIPKSKEVINTVVGIIKEYLSSFESQKAIGKGLYIFSNTKGSGKTRMAASLANELMTKHNMQVKFSTSTSIINEIKKTWNKDNEYNESDLLDALSTTPVLIIDDFGTEDVKGWIDEKFYSIINERYQNKKITIYTSNHSLNELKYGERIKSRVKETSYLIPFPEECVRDYIADHDNTEMLNKLRR